MACIWVSIQRLLKSREKIVVFACELRRRIVDGVLKERRATRIMGQALGKLCSKSINLESINLSHQLELQQKDLDLKKLELHLNELHQKELRNIYECILIVSVIAAVIICCLMILTFYLVGIRDEKRRQLENQISKYEGILEEKKHRIQELEKRQDANAAHHHEPQHAHALHAHQQPIVYAFPGLPPSK